MSKVTGSPFGRPNRGPDADRFVEQGTAALRPVAEPPLAPTPGSVSLRPSAPSTETRSVNSYKHKEINHLRLKRLSQKLDRNMGDMLDEALEARFAEWLAAVPPEESLF
jgi:hypothetical protein